MACTPGGRTTFWLGGGGELGGRLRYVEAAEPVVRVVCGDPSDEELAALVSVLVAGARSATGRPAPRHSYWLRSARPAATVAGLPADRGRHGWRVSALPR